jgi:DNA-binding MarR family transcriptional regulator
MTIDALDLCLKLSQAHASLNLKLDDDLGTFHGLGWNDFILLRLLSRSDGGRSAVADLVRPMGLQLSAVTRQLVLMEKTGWIQREGAATGGGRGHVVLRPAGRRLLDEALETAGAVCAGAISELPPESLRSVDAALSVLCVTGALRL